MVKHSNGVAAAAQLIARRKAVVIPECKHCGSQSTLIKAQAQGSVELHFDERGTHCEDAYEKLAFIHRGVIRCADCLKIRRDLVHNGTTVEPLSFLTSAEPDVATWESLGRSIIEHEPDQTYGAAD